MVRSRYVALVPVAFVTGSCLTNLMRPTILVPQHGEDGPLRRTNIPTTTMEGAIADGFSLAYEQSEGFFDDIPDEMWRRMQKIASDIFPNHFRDVPTEYSHRMGHKGKDIQVSNKWYAENFHEEFHCPLIERVPNDGAPDGPKWVCNPSRIARQQSCLVYSVGSWGDVTFEKGVKNQISPDCEIHTFDIQSSNRQMGNFAKNLDGYATFHPWGLSTEETAQKHSIYKTVKDTIQALGHENRTIDIFKIDCEG
jgi:Methyltransferase domain